MKKTIILMLLLCVTLLTWGQRIKETDRFFDGYSVYSAEVRMNGDVVCLHELNNDWGEVTIQRVQGKTGEYKLIPSRQAEEPPFHCSWNSRVRYIRQEGMNFLAFYNDDGLIVETFVLTPDTPENCEAQQAWASEQPPLEMVSNYLMNSQYLMSFDVPTLQKMLQKLEGIKKRSIIEDVNFQLITTMIARQLAEANEMSESVG